MRIGRGATIAVAALVLAACGGGSDDKGGSMTEGAVKGDSGTTGSAPTVALPPDTANGK
jgi:major membrane immunogen (membrane-anchored lipoprotein)